MAMALDAEHLDDVGARIRKLLDLSPPGASMGEKIGAVMRLAPLANAAPRIVRDGSCHEVIDREPDLRALPVLTTWPLDAGPFITLPLVITTRSAEPEPTTSVCTACKSTSRAKPACTGSATSTDARTPTRGDDRVPVAVAIGTDPALTYAATAPLPPMLDEFAFAGLLRGKPVELVKATTVDLNVPAHAEFVLEGYVDNDRHARRGSVRRPYRRLQPRRPLSDVSRHVHHAPPRPDLRSDGRRKTADGRRVARKGDGAHLPAAAADGRAGGHRHESAGRGRLPQSRARLDHAKRIRAMPRR